jgi:hypothetical protein
MNTHHSEDYDKLKREYELTKQEMKNRSETETNRIINFKKKLEKAYNNTLEEELVFEDYSDVLQSIKELQENADQFIKSHYPNP